MRIAHIITAHKYPEQLEYLIKTMKHSDFDFYIHIDKKVDIRAFKHLEEIDRVYFITDRTYCTWGGFSLITAIVKSIDQINASGITYDFVSLLSAQDFPIKPIEKIHDFFEKNIGYSFVSYRENSDMEWWEHAQLRYKKYHFTDSRIKANVLLQNIVNAIAPDRTFLDSIKLYGGSKSTWWTISIDCAVYLSNFLKTNPKLVSKLKLTWGCDEFITATILMNSPYADKIVNNNYRYIVFSGDQAHPDILNLNDFEKLINSDMLFARKFDLEIDSKILNKLHEHVTGTAVEKGII